MTADVGTDEGRLKPARCLNLSRVVKNYRGWPDVRGGEREEVTPR